MLTRNGENDPHIRIYHLDLKEFLADSIGPVMFNDSRGVSMAWAPDNSGIYYTQAPPTAIQTEKYFNGKIKFHKIGADPAEDEAIFGSGLNPSIPLKLGESTDAAGAREEKSVGPKNTPDGFRSNYAISAVHHIPSGKSLPGLLIIHGATDFIISLSPVARYAARYQDKQAGHRPVLFRAQWEGGHLGAEGEIFDILRFAFWQTGIRNFSRRNNIQIKRRTFSLYRV